MKSRSPEEIRAIDKSRLLAAAVVLIIYAMIVGALGNSAAMALAIVASLACLFFAYLESFKKFKASASGFEGEMRDVRDRALATLEQLQEMAALIGRLQVSTMVRGSRLSSLTSVVQEAAVLKLKELLTKIEVPAQQIEECLVDFHRFIELDYGDFITRIEERPSEGFWKDWKPLRESGNPVSVDVLESLLRKHDCLSLDREGLLEDYRYYIDHRKHRRPRVWHNLNRTAELGIGELKVLLAE